MPASDVPRNQGRYWLVTLSCEKHPDQPQLSDHEKLVWIKGQKESGESTGYLHWQFVVAFNSNVRRGVLERVWDTCHAELTRSKKADDYVFKEETRIEGTQFEHGAKAFKRNSSADWDLILQSARSGDLTTIPSDVYIRYYRTLKQIAADHVVPVDMARRTLVYWGKTGTGKSYSARKEAGDYYIKNPNTKWWDGYRGESNVVIDEFRGRIDISYLLIWLDEYKATVEVKGTHAPLCASRFWICSNLHPRDWYPNADEETRLALFRRLEIREFQSFRG